MTRMNCAQISLVLKKLYCRPLGVLLLTHLRIRIWKGESGKPAYLEHPPVLQPRNQSPLRLTRSPSLLFAQSSSRINTNLKSAHSHHLLQLFPRPKAYSNRLLYRASVVFAAAAAAASFSTVGNIQSRSGHGWKFSPLHQPQHPDTMVSSRFIELLDPQSHASLPHHNDVRLEDLLAQQRRTDKSLATGASRDRSTSSTSLSSSTSTSTSTSSINVSVLESTSSPPSSAKSSSTPKPRSKRFSLARWWYPDVAVCLPKDTLLLSIEAKEDVSLCEPGL